MSGNGSDNGGFENPGLVLFIVVFALMIGLLVLFMVVIFTLDERLIASYAASVYVVIPFSTTFPTHITTKRKEVPNDRL